MVELPVVSGAEAVKAFQRAGWRIDRQKGSHVVLLKATSRACRCRSTPRWRQER
jgi:predicted RNA binding protein YcfA (HicA-like mRNA interferase family)